MTKVYNGKTNVVTNTQDAPTGTSLKDTSALMGKITYVGRIGSDTVASIDGAYEDKNAGTTKKVTYTLTNTNSNYKLLDASATDTSAAKAKGDALTYDGTGIITPKNITVQLGTVTKTYDGETDASNKTGYSVSFDSTQKQSDGTNTDSVAPTAYSAKYVDSSDGAGDAADAGIGTKKVRYQFMKANDTANNYTITGATADGKNYDVTLASSSL